MMSYLFTAAEVGVSYAFPQVGAAIQTYRWVKTAYLVTKSTASYLTGDFVSGTIGVAQIAGTAHCESQRDICINACMRSGMWGGVEVGACIVGCDLAYRACMAMYS